MRAGREGVSGGAVEGYRGRSEAESDGAGGIKEVGLSGDRSKKVW